jgi:hypothetical protein
MRARESQAISSLATKDEAHPSIELRPQDSEAGKKRAADEPHASAGPDPPRAYASAAATSMSPEHS